MRQNIWMQLCGAALLLAVASPAATSFTPFGPKGQGGSKNGQNFMVGSGGAVFELDAFLRIDGYDLNGGQNGTSAQLSSDALPAGLDFSYTAGVSNDTDAVLTYQFVNTSGGTFTNLRFAVLLDAEIDQELNTFFNEYGNALGTLGAGASDIAPDMWQIDEPGFAGGTLFDNLYQGSLNDSNAISLTASNDVAFGLGFFLGDLPNGQSASVSVMISGSGHSLGTFALRQFDQNSDATRTVTLSAIVSTLTGTIFRDNNTNGVFDAGEGLFGAKLRLLSGETEIAVAITDTNGNYSFSSPPGGTYTVRVDPTTIGASLTNSFDPDGVLDGQTTTSISPGQLVILNWGYQAPPSAEQFGDATLLVSMDFNWRLKQSTGTLLGTLSLTNLPGSSLSLAGPFQLGLPTSTNFWLAHPAGTLENGVPYVNVTTGVVAQAGDDETLSPGEGVVLVDGVEIYSRNRHAPPPGSFLLWATQRP